MVLGLDLQGGSHLLLQVNREGIVSERLRELRRDARGVLVNQNLGNIITTEGNGIVVELTDPNQQAAAMTALQGLQNVITGQLLSVGGVEELTFATRPD